MNKTIWKFLLVGDKFVPEMHLTESEFMYSACEPFTKNKKQKINNVKKQEIYDTFIKMT